MKKIAPVDFFGESCLFPRGKPAASLCSLVGGGRKESLDFSSKVLRPDCCCRCEEKRQLSGFSSVVLPQVEKNVIPSSCWANRHGAGCSEVSQSLGWQEAQFLSWSRQTKKGLLFYQVGKTFCQHIVIAQSNGSQRKQVRMLFLFLNLSSFKAILRVCFNF